MVSKQLRKANQLATARRAPGPWQLAYPSSLRMPPAPLHSQGTPGGQCAGPSGSHPPFFGGPAGFADIHAITDTRHNALKTPLRPPLGTVHCGRPNGGHRVSRTSIRRATDSTCCCWHSAHTKPNALTSLHVCCDSNAAAAAHLAP